MLTEFGIAKRVWSRWTALVVAAGLVAACVDETVAPAPETGPPPPLANPRVVGFAELTFSGIGTPDMASSLLVAPTIEELEVLRAQRERTGDLRDVITQDLTFPANSDSSGNGTIQLRLDEPGNFPFDGVRYLSSTFDVRNAQSDGTAYDIAHNNITFLAVSTSSTINQTAVRRLVVGDGTPEARALQVLPTDRMEVVSDTLRASHPDVLQVLRENEVAAVLDALPPSSDVTSVFPYGFVVRRAGDNTTRELPAPTDNTFPGRVDFAFSIPDSANFQSLSVMMIAVIDSDTRLTQGPQEQTVVDQLALQQLRSSLIGADTVTLLPGGTLPGVSGLRTICSVRTAGPAGAATANLVNVDWTFQDIDPDPNTTIFIPTVEVFEARFNAPVEGGGPSTFTVRGLQSGPKFVGQNYGGNGTNIIQTPPASFSLGEEVEVVLTSALVCPGPPRVGRYLVSAPSSSAPFDTVSTTVGPAPAGVAIGNLRPAQPSPGLDIVVINAGGNGTASVLLGNNDGTFTPHGTSGVGPDPIGIALGDLNGDTFLDFVTANSRSSAVAVLLNDGDANFQPAPSPTVSGGFPAHPKLGDLNGDGYLDIVTPNSNTGVSVLLGNGDGTFQTEQTYSVHGPSDVALGDVSGDDFLDLVTVSNVTTAGAFVLRGNGDGTFQPAQSFSPGLAGTSVAIGQLNAGVDMFPDIAVCHGSAANVSVHFGDGQGSFPDSTTVPVDTTSDLRRCAIDIGNMESDPNLDIVVAMGFQTLEGEIGSGAVLAGDGQGSFSAGRRFGLQASPSDVALGNIDSSNGVLDIVVTNADGTVTVLRAATP